MSKLLILPVARLASCVLFLVFLIGCSSEAKKARFLERADRFFATEQFDEARIEYMNLLRESPRDPHAIRQLGFIWMEQGAPARAISALADALGLEPAHAAARKELASAYFSLRQMGDARREALAVLDASPADEDALLLLANTSVTEEQIEETSQRLQSFDAKSSAALLASAMLSSRKGDSEAAKVALDQALAADPESVSVQLALATYYQATNQPEQQRAALRKAADLSPARSGARLRHIRALARAGETGEAMSLLEKLTAEAADFIPAWVLLAELTAREGNNDEALVILEKVLARDSINLAALTTKAGILLDTGEVETATGILEELKDTYPGNPGLKFGLARLYLQQGKTGEARATIDAALAVYPEYPEAIMLRARMDLGGGDAIASAAALEALLQKQPDLGEAQLLLAGSYQAQGRLDDAAAIYRARIEIGTDGVGPHYTLGGILRAQGKAEEARQHFEAAQELAPDDQTITFELVELDIADEKFDSAHDRVRKVIEKNPDDWGGLFLDAKVYAAEKKWREAEPILLKALTIKPDSVTIYDLLIDSYLALEQQAEAIERLNTYLATNPKSVRHRMMVALLEGEAGNHQAAAQTYEQILADYPDFLPAMNNLAVLYGGPIKNSLEKAEKLARKARALQPESPSIADTLGWILYRNGDYQQALTFLEEAGGKTGDYPEIQYHMGMARYMMGREESARIALEKAAVAEMEFPGKQEAQQRLEFLSGGETALANLSIEQLEARLADQADDVIARLRLGRLREEQGAPAKAADAYQAALKSNPKLTLAMMGLARIYTGAGPLDDIDKALGFALQAREQAPDDPETAGILGRIRLAQGDVIAAHSLLQDALRSEKADATLRRDFAMAAYGQGKVDAARKAMEALAKDVPDTDISREAAAFLTLTDAARAGSAAVQALAATRLETVPDNVPALMARAAHEEPDAATATCERILEIWPGFPLAQILLADLYAQDPDRLEAAQTLARKARESLPDDPKAARTLGVISALTGEPDYAVQLLEQSAKATPLDAEALYYLGMACLESGKDESGAASLRAALEQGLPGSLAEKAEQAVSAGVSGQR